MAAVYVVFRLISLILIAVALMLMGADVIASFEKGGVVVRTIEQFWTIFDAGGLSTFKTWVGASVPAPLSEWIYSVLSMWAFGVTGVIGVILAFLFGRRTADV